MSKEEKNRKGEQKVMQQNWLEKNERYMLE